MLAELLGCPSVAVMLEGMTSYEISEWKAHLKLSNEEQKHIVNEARKA